VRLLDTLRAYPQHPDPATAACNRIALLVASSQPLYPLYVWWIVGGDWWVSFWTYLSTPFFAAVPAVARRDAIAGRALLPLAGMANLVLSAKAFGEASGVEWFMLPCMLIAVLAFRGSLGPVLGLLGVATIPVLLHGHYAQPLGQFTEAEYGRFARLNADSVAVLSAATLWIFSRARPSSASH